MRYVLVLVLVVLSACASIQTSKLTYQEPANWPAQQKRLAAIDNWTLQGAISARNAINGWSASLHWEQRGKTYKARLIAPMGSGHILIYGDEDGVTLIDSKKQRLKAPTAQALLAGQTNVPIPIDNLYYWARGLAVPGDSAKRAFDGEGVLRRLYQQGWTIDYLSYRDAGELRLPRKINFRKGELRMRLVVNRWSLN